MLVGIDGYHNGIERLSEAYLIELYVRRTLVRGQEAVHVSEELEHEALDCTRLFTFAICRFVVVHDRGYVTAQKAARLKRCIVHNRRRLVREQRRLVREAQTIAIRID